MSAHLVAIDLQRVFADPDGQWGTPGFARVVDPVRALARALGPQRTTFTRFVAPQRPTGAWVDYYDRWPFALAPLDDPMWHLVDEVADLAAGTTVDAATFGKWGEPLASRVGDADELLVAGVSTDCCVLSTVLAAADAGRRVRVVADACAGVDEPAHERALAAMALYAPLVEVTSSAEVLAALR